MWNLKLGKMTWIQQMGQIFYPFNVVFATIKKEYIPIRHREGFLLSAGIGVITKDLIIFLYIKQFVKIFIHLFYSFINWGYDMDLVFNIWLWFPKVVCCNWMRVLIIILSNMIISIPSPLVFWPKIMAASGLIETSFSSLN